MTVCIAAICGKGGTIIGASDRMLTALAQYQSPERKTYGLTSSIVALWAGDASFQGLILHELKADIAARIAAAPTDWLNVRDVAYLYQWYYNRAKRRLVEQGVLAPYGLDTASFLSTHQTMAPRLAARLFEEMRSVSVPGIETLIVGMDNSGAHIYEFENLRSLGDVFCHDAVGFAAIGSGAFQAASQFMLAGHGPSRSIEETMFLTYLAKKRSQAAPGVGEATDMFIFGGQAGRPGYYDRLRDDIYPALEEAYKRLNRAEGTAMATAEQRIKTFLLTLPPPTPPPGQASSAVTLTPGPGELTITGLPPTVTITPPSAPEVTGRTGVTSGLLAE